MHDHELQKDLWNGKEEFHHEMDILLSLNYKLGCTNKWYLMEIWTIHETEIIFNFVVFVGVWTESRKRPCTPGWIVTICKEVKGWMWVSKWVWNVNGVRDSHHF